MSEFPEFNPVGFRKGELLKVMKKNGINGILLSSPENVFYTTGYTTLPSSGNPIIYSLRKLFPFFSFISEDGEVTLGCWGFSTLGVKFGVDAIAGFSSTSEAGDVLKKLLKDKLRPGGVLGIESTTTYNFLELIHQVIPTIKLVIADEHLLHLRLIKSAEEIRLLKKSNEIIETTLVELYDCIKPGMSRLDLIKEAKTRLFKNGAMGVSHITFTFGKANPEIAIGETLGPNQLVVFDLGGIYEGYTSDNRRYGYTGKVPGALAEHYNKMVSIVDKVGEFLIPGTTYTQIYHHALDLYQTYGIDFTQNTFNHVGHNMGLETEEDWLIDEPIRKVEPGMVINIELYSTAQTGDSIGNEETYLVESTGPVRISTLPREIHKIH